MNDLAERIRLYLESRTQRERWIGVLGICVLSMLFVNGIWVGPLVERASALEMKIEQLDGDLMKSQRLVNNVRHLQGEVTRIEALINNTERTDLLSLLEQLAQGAGLSQEQIDSVTPKPSTAKKRYPETRVEVRLKGATLPQLVDFLFRIETADQHLIVRTLRITTRGKEDQVLDVSFSVSSFQA